MGTESFLARNTRVNRAIHDRGGFLLLDSMTCDISCSAKIGAEMAKENTRNEKITKKILEARFSAFAYASRLICVCIAMTWAARPSWNRTLCVLTSGQIWAYK
ncbi:hypothetical protein PIB30_087224 [Stylosanthes scabra]|uniref:Uncharacterized protein n=1 Tax=Stylosanthes scabra TaxID=79078 RepID=A0ABU6TTZ2_9FABA|nr:hypothetical protein [Stylosanthes scabra]